MASSIQKLFKDINDRLQKNYLTAFLPDNNKKLLEDLKLEYNTNFQPDTPAMKWYVKNFNNTPVIVEILKALALRAYYYPKERLEIFREVAEIIKPNPLKELLSFGASKNQLDPKKLSEKDLYIYSLFRDKVKENQVVASHIIYKGFLHDFMTLTNEDTRYNVIPEVIKDKFTKLSDNIKSSDSPQEVEKLFEPLLNYYAIIPSSALNLLIHYLAPEYVSSTLPLFFNNFKNQGIDFNQLMYCWADHPHTPLVAMSYIETEPQALIYFIEEGLGLSTTRWYQKELKIKIHNNLDDLSQHLVKRVENDMDWRPEDVAELKTLLERKILLSKVGKDNISPFKKNFKL